MAKPGTGSSSSGTAEARRLPRIALVAASLEIVGGQSIEADLLAKALRRESYDVIQIAVNPRLPRGLQGVRRVRAARTLRDLARSAGGDRIRFLGQVAPGRIPALLDEADVFLSRRARTESERYSWEGVRGSWARIYGWARLVNPERPAPVAAANPGARVP